MLREKLERVEKEKEALQSPVSSLQSPVSSLQSDKSLLTYRLDTLLRRLYGRSSERLGPDQLPLFDVTSTGGEDSSPAETEKIRYRRKKKKGHGRAAFPEHLPREVIAVELPEEERTCGTCTSDLRKIRDGVIDKGKWEASAYAHVVVSKYADHQPLHRQVGIFRRHGIETPKSTIGDMALRCAELVEPVTKQMKMELLEERVLGADETPIQVITGKGKGASREGFIWCYRRKARIVYEFRDRTRDGPLDFLGAWDGALVVDDYAGYDEVCRRNEISRAGSWAHARRKFVEALDSDRPRAAKAIRHIDRLFWIERAVTARVEASTLQPAIELRREVRDRRSRVVVERLRKLLLEWRDDPEVLPKGPLGKAARYLIRPPKKGSTKPEKWDRYVAFLDNPEVPIHNNDTENALRTVALGRKNWMLAGSEKGARAAATLYSLMATCRALEVNPQEYLEDVLRRLDIETDVARLTPWAWKEARSAPSP